MTVINQTSCVQQCVFTFVEPEKDAGGENAICLSTATIGAFILISGLYDVSRICVSEWGLNRRKWTRGGNRTIFLIGLAKIAAGISFICNAYRYEPFKWNAEILDKCRTTCSDLLTTFTTSPPSNREGHGPCCPRCVDDLIKPSSADNFGLGIGWGVTLICTGTFKTIYNVASFGGKFLKKFCEPKTLVNLPVREWRIANTNFLNDLMEIAYAIAIFILITSNELGDDENLYDSSMSTYDSWSSNTLTGRCLSFCNFIIPSDKNYFCR